MNDYLGEGFHYVQTLYIGTKETFLYWDLQFNIEAKYKDKYWTYTVSPSLVISTVRSRTYDELKQAYMNLELNFSRLESSLHTLQWYEEAYENIVNDYNSLFRNYTSIKETLEETQSELNSTKLELENIRSNLNAAYGQIAIWQTVTVVVFIVGFVTMYVIGVIGKKRFPRKGSSESKV